MPKILKSSLIMFLINFLTCAEAKSQGVTPADFKLCLDDLGCKNVRITKDQLLKAKGVYANFSWFKIESITIYIGQGNYSDEITTIADSSNLFSKRTKEFFRKWIRPPKIITIVAHGTNPQGIDVKWADLFLTVVEN